MLVKLVGNLAPVLWDKICENVSEDPKSLVQFGLTSRAFHKIAKPCLYFIKVANYISENYTLQTSKDYQVKLWKLLKLCPVVLLGEDHTNDTHRKINAFVTHALWHPKYRQLLTESKMPAGIGPVKYIINPAIVETSKSWDIKSEWFESYLEQIQNNTLLFQQFIALFNACGQANFTTLAKEYLESIKLHHPEADLISLEELIDEIEAMPPFDYASKGVGKITVTAEEMLQITLPLNRKQEFLSRTLSMIGTFVVKLEKFANQKIQEESLARSMRFFKAIIDEWQQKKRPLAIAGSAHLEDSRFVRALNRARIPFLCAIPNDTSPKMAANLARRPLSSIFLSLDTKSINGVNYHTIVQSLLLYYAETSREIYARLDRSKALLDQLKRDLAPKS